MPYTRALPPGRALFIMLVPYRWRRAHHWYARTRGYFWLPCPLCGREFGGHEWRHADGLAAAIPTPGGEPGEGTGICPPCTAAGLGSDTY